MTMAKIVSAWENRNGKKSLPKALESLAWLEYKYGHSKVIEPSALLPSFHYLNQERSAMQEKSE